MGSNLAMRSPGARHRVICCENGTESLVTTSLDRSRPWASSKCFSFASPRFLIESTERVSMSRLPFFASLSRVVPERADLCSTAGQISGVVTGPCGARNRCNQMESRKYTTLLNRMSRSSWWRMGGGHTLVLTYAASRMIESNFESVDVLLSV
jgi:hypothetical protein